MVANLIGTVWTLWYMVAILYGDHFQGAHVMQQKPYEIILLSKKSDTTGEQGEFSGGCFC